MRSPMPRAIAVLLLGSSVIACSGASGSASPGGVTTPPTGSTGASPTMSATMPASPAASAPSAAPSEAAVSSPPFTLESPAFAAGAAIPSRFTCDGSNASPPLAWRGAPSGTASFVLIVRDPDARNFTHWVAYEIPGATSGSLPEAIARSVPSPKQGRNDFGKDGYGGPCPPSGTHHYVFRLAALDRTLGLDDGKTASAVETAMAGHVLATAELIGTYARH